MGKEIDLWDDSALINAFDHAMSTYKAMHRESYPVNPLEEKTLTSESNQFKSGHTEILAREIDDHGENNVMKDVTETNMPSYKDLTSTEGLQFQEGILGASICPTESNPCSSDFPVAAMETDKYNYQQSVEYNNLLKQYYELEEQRQKVLQQLQQANYWNYQDPVQSGQHQAEQVPTNNVSDSCSQPICSLCSCPSLALPSITASSCAICGPSFGGYYCWPQNCSTSLPHQFSGGQCHIQSGICSVGTSYTVDPSKKTTHIDDQAVRITEKEKGKEEEISDCGTNRETDLAVVLSAWYSAGFHTGRQEDFNFIDQTLLLSFLLWCALLTSLASA
ncbi:hypothetical protein B296_00049130 [Ensete ventricosum]|uniref:Survival Motor Neuron Gemin2-binding domain-containing protein n=1 Tax=Ensete ventricosum TaxID=4639 RepID=A0A426YS37_ENSVE|nr:hypothetical protein B296_00049130 [Ensete ventricosum]